MEGTWKTPQALEYTRRRGIHVTRQTIVNWVSKHGLGFQKNPIPKPVFGRGGTWYIYPDKFKSFVGAYKYGKKKKKTTSRTGGRRTRQAFKGEVET